MSIRRYGDIILPMDETLIMCAIDLSGRPYLGFESTFTADSVGYFDTQMVKEFFYAISYSAGMNLHIRKIAGENDHHIIEGMFKAFAKALDEATVKDIESRQFSLLREVSNILKELHICDYIQQLMLKTGSVSA